MQFSATALENHDVRGAWHGPSSGNDWKCHYFASGAGRVSVQREEGEGIVPMKIWAARMLPAHRCWRMNKLASQICGSTGTTRDKIAQVSLSRFCLKLPASHCSYLRGLGYGAKNFFEEENLLDECIYMVAWNLFKVSGIS